MGTGPPNVIWLHATWPRLTQRSSLGRDGVAHLQNRTEYQVDRGRPGGPAHNGFMKKSIKLFQLTIKHDKLFLPSYQNLIYIYDEMDEGNKAAKYQKLYEKRRDELIRSFDREEQIKLGVEKEYIFRVNLGTFGEFEAPADMFDEDYIITVPINERKTAYLAGMFYTLDEAVEYQKTMLKRGYVTAYIVAFKDGEKLEF